MFENQTYPPHYHEKKNETYFILYGDLEVKVDDQVISLKQGDTYTVQNNTIHSFSTKNGVIFEEIATTYITGDSKYLDKNKMEKHRKTEIKFFD